MIWDTLAGFRKIININIPRNKQFNQRKASPRREFDGVVLLPFFFSFESFLVNFFVCFLKFIASIGTIERHNIFQHQQIAEKYEINKLAMKFDISLSRKFME